MDIQKFAHISDEYQKQNIRWARISPDAQGTGGVYILLCQELSQRSLFDYWFENVDVAQRWAYQYYGIKEGDWRSKEDLERDGVQIIEEA